MLYDHSMQTTKGKVLAPQIEVLQGLTSVAAFVIGAAYHVFTKVLSSNQHEDT